MLDRDVVVLEPARFLPGRIQHAGQPLRDTDLAGIHARTRDPGASGELGLQCGPEPVRVSSSLDEQPGSDAFWLVEEREEQVLAVYLGVPETECLCLCVVQCFLRLLRQA